MTGFLLAALSVVPRRRMTRSALPKQSKLAQAVVELEQRFGDGGNYKLPPQPDVLGLWKRLDAAETAHDYEAITDKDWRDSPWCVWLKVGDATTLAQRPSFARRYGRWIEARNRKPDYRRLVQAWLLHFNLESPPRSAATLILRACEQWPEWLWAQRHATYDLFDVKQGPPLLAERVLDDERSVSEVLQEHGLGEWLQTGGYANAAFAALLKDLPRRLRTSVSAARTQQWIERVITWSLRNEKELRFPTLNKALAESLLLPWVSSEPTAAVEKKLTAFLVTPPMLGDPRLHRARWNGIKPEASSVLERWLNRETLNAFIRIIKEATKGDAVAKDHWQERRAFWMAYQDAEHIEKVWIALGPEAESIAHKHTNLNGQFGRLTKQRSMNHSVLLLRIGGLLIADWSHNGSCRIWRARSPNPPNFELYESEYWGEELRVTCDMPAPHEIGKRHNGDWQRVIHDFIYDETGITVSDYYP